MNQESETQFQQRKAGGWLKVISLSLSIAITVGAIVATYAKSYYETPIQLREHDKRIEKLEAADAARVKELNEIRQLLWEIRGDVKYLRREN